MKNLNLVINSEQFTRMLRYHIHIGNDLAVIKAHHTVKGDSELSLMTIKSLLQYYIKGHPSRAINFIQRCILQEIPLPPEELKIIMEGFYKTNTYSKTDKDALWEMVCFQYFPTHEICELAINKHIEDGKYLKALKRIKELGERKLCDKIQVSITRLLLIFAEKKMEIELNDCWGFITDINEPDALELLNLLSYDPYTYSTWISKISQLVPELPDLVIKPISQADLVKLVLKGDISTVLLALRKFDSPSNDLTALVVEDLCRINEIDAAERLIESYPVDERLSLHKAIYQLLVAYDRLQLVQKVLDTFKSIDIIENDLLNDFIIDFYMRNGMYNDAQSRLEHYMENSLHSKKSFIEFLKSCIHLDRKKDGIHILEWRRCTLLKVDKDILTAYIGFCVHFVPSLAVKYIIEFSQHDNIHPDCEEFELVIDRLLDIKDITNSYVLIKRMSEIWPIKITLIRKHLELILESQYCPLSVQEVIRSIENDSNDASKELVLKVLDVYSDWSSNREKKIREQLDFAKILSMS